MEIAILFVFGLVLGSFLNVVSLRYKENKFVFDPKIIGGRSHCPHCKKQLRAFELIPVVSFILQRGRCRHCDKRISFQYPIVELIAAFIVSLVPFFIRSHAFFFFKNPHLGEVFFNGSVLENVFVSLWTLFFLILLLISIIDLRKLIIPDELNIILVLIGVAIFIITVSVGVFGDFSGSFTGSYASLFGLRGSIFINRLAGIFFSAAFLGAIILLSRGRAMGMGDLKLIAAIGVTFGWPDTILILMLSFVVGSVASLSLIALRRKKIKDKIPFGPFIALASAILFFFGPQIISGYFQIFGI